MVEQRGKNLQAALFLEGRSIPFMGATLNYNVGSPGTATISAVPLRELNNVLPRTLCHIFVKDNSYKGVAKPWVLLFEGEIYGIGGSKNSNNRSTTLYAIDYSNYWDNAKQSYVNLKSGAGGVGLIKSTADSKSDKVAQIKVVNVGTSTKAYLTSLIYKELEKGKDFAEAVKIAIGGVKDANSFFRYGDARVRLDERIAFASSGKIKELFSFEKKETLIDAVLGRGNGSVNTLRTVINSLLGMVFHELVSVPAPSKIDSSTVKDRFKNSTLKNVDPKIKGIGAKFDQSIGSFLFKPESFMLPPPRCNILFPDMYNSTNFRRIFFDEVTRTSFKPFLPSAITKNNVALMGMLTKHSPSGMHEFTTEEKTDETNKSFTGPEGQGFLARDADGSVKSSSTLQEFSYQSYEEILKGIFSDFGMTMPSAQMIQGTSKIKDQKQYTQAVSDFLFHKKRLASRTANPSGPLNIAAVPGLPMLVLDDSDAEQHLLGTLTGLTHTINAQSGGYTSYNLNFVRYTEEIDFWSGEAYEPPIEPWYDEETFGKRRAVTPEDYKLLKKSQQGRIGEMGFINDFGNSKLSGFYKKLLGNTDTKSHMGAEPLTSKNFPCVAAATIGLLNSYRAAKKSGSVSDFISLQTRRDYVTLVENFAFLGATFKNPKTDPTFWKEADLVFKGPIFDGAFVDIAVGVNSRDTALADLFGKKATEKRRKPIDAYRKRLKNERGFNG